MIRHILNVSTPPGSGLPQTEPQPDSTQSNFRARQVRYRLQQAHCWTLTSDTKVLGNLDNIDMIYSRYYQRRKLEKAKRVHQMQDGENNHGKLALPFRNYISQIFSQLGQSLRPLAVKQITKMSNSTSPILQRKIFSANQRFETWNPIYRLIHWSHWETQNFFSFFSPNHAWPRSALCSCHIREIGTRSDRERSCWRWVSPLFVGIFNLVWPVRPD